MTNEVFKSLLRNSQLAEKYNITEEDIPKSFSEGISSKHQHVKILSKIFLSIAQGQSDRDLNITISQLFNEIES